MKKRWKAGETVMLRNCGFFMGEAWCTPHIVVQDGNDLVVLFRPEGTRFQIWRLDEERFVETRPTRMDMLRLMLPGRGYAVELFFDTGKGVDAYPTFEGEERFRGWKVNIEAPFVRSEIGFDTTDHFLDIVVRPDRRWFWKDEEQIRGWLDKGAYTPDEVEAYIQAGHDVEPLIEGGAFPFDDRWTWWEPPLKLRPPNVAQGWQLLPGCEITLGLGRRWDAWRREPSP